LARSDIRFLHGFEPHSLDGVDPSMTVLKWLREDQGRTGTKEGCAEGDCGACTVVLARLEGNGLRYRAVNACILFLPQLDGAQLITVEHLRNENGGLHPIQQAMVDHHASQCGFCTPGFVMSLFAIAKGVPEHTRETVADGLAGNLCRCTGYRPIIDAALDALEEPSGDLFEVRVKETISALKALRKDEMLAIEVNGKRFQAPRDVGALSELVETTPKAHLLAGGTDIGLWVTKQHRDLKTVIDVTRAPELQEIETSATHLRIGSAVTYQQIHATIRDRWADFGELIRRIGGMQVREAGTIGGNIANGSPIGDTMPALIALETKLVLQKGRRQRSLELEEFYLDYQKTALEPGEFVLRIDIPLPTTGSLFKCYKISKRFDQDISAVMAAFSLVLDANQTVKRIRIGFGGMAAIPKRTTRTEQAMLGKPWTITTIEEGQKALAEELKPLSDMRASADYRLTVAQNLLRKFYIETTEPKTLTRILETT